MTATNLPISERVRLAIEATGSSINQVAMHAEIPQPTLSNIINGHRKPSFDTLERLVGSQTRISAEYLLRGQGDPLLPLTGPTQ